MKLTPLDIRHREFRRAVRGYSDEDVDVFLDEVADEFERLYQDNIDFKERLRALEDQVDQYESLKETLQNTLVSAQRQAEETKANARKEAELILRDAELKSRDIVNEAYSQKQRVQQALIQLRQIEEDFRFKFRSLLQAHLNLLEEDETSDERREFQGLVSEVEADLASGGDGGESDDSGAAGGDSGSLQSVQDADLPPFLAETSLAEDATQVTARRGGAASSGEDSAGGESSDGEAFGWVDGRDPEVPNADEMERAVDQTLEEMDVSVEDVPVNDENGIVVVRRVSDAAEAGGSAIRESEGPEAGEGRSDGGPDTPDGEDGQQDAPSVFDAGDDDDEDAGFFSSRRSRDFEW